MKTASRHMFRRTARKREHALERIETERMTLEPPRRYRYYVERSRRGPFGWRVVEVRL
jgi:hypothetical protein